VIWQSKLRQRAFGDAEFFEGLHLVEQFEGVRLAAEQILIGADGFRGVLRLVEQLDAEAGESS